MRLWKGCGLFLLEVLKLAVGEALEGRFFSNYCGGPEEGLSDIRGTAVTERAGMDGDPQACELGWVLEAGTGDPST